MIRKAMENDIPVLLDIYNDSILNGTASFEEEPLTYEEGQRWLKEHQEAYPILIFEDDGQLLGFASLSPYGRKRETAYCSAEISIYVSKKAQGKGVGSRLMDAIIEAAYHAPKIKQLISVITEGNQGSILLHEKKGFIYGGRLVNVAEKHNELLSVVYYQKDVTKA
ncbi:GNAT family N-acetyltransferase [Petrocella sp. FN5]|uniref:GNAT family N-acetyltransferase n=1 Tax=Petrocella sp. FN5 TaxID=3032002 RepID=UPI0023DC0894|nr:GNAT family N-acetyltransferase [Petrocella sp. FN5]MDF1616882.1 GNAT family N-acetyltransferase [Petrocella sp. FN5]